MSNTQVLSSSVSYLAMLNATSVIDSQEYAPTRDEWVNCWWVFSVVVARSIKNSKSHIGLVNGQFERMNDLALPLLQDCVVGPDQVERTATPFISKSTALVLMGK